MYLNATKLSKTRIIVMGDVMLDRYLWSNVNRISPEAPVPVIRIKERSEVLGGAGNVAANLAGLGCQVALIAVHNADDAGLKLKELLADKRVENILVQDDSRPTTTKTRIMAKQQQLFRLDEEETHPLSPDIAERVITLLSRHLHNCQAVILSDYGKGIFQTPDVCQRAITLCRQNNIPVIIDPKGSDWERYHGASCITPNLAELEYIIQKQVDDDVTLLSSYAKNLRNTLNLDWLLVTRGAKGMYLSGGDNNTQHFITAQAREVFDVSGAGDTVIATLAAGLAMNWPYPKAAQFANIAAGVVVSKVGTQPIHLNELSMALRVSHGRRDAVLSSKLFNREAARLQVQEWRTAGQKIVFTNGCFDLLHPGHITLLHQSRAMGDRLIVGINTDASVKRLKGDSRPILGEQDRSAILSALACVDMVVLFDEDTPLSLITALTPDIIVKGSDYKKNDVVGGDVVTAYGGEVRLVPILKGYSTTKIASKASRDKP